MNKRDKRDLAAFVIFCTLGFAVIGGILVDVWTNPSPVASVINEVTYTATIPVDFGR